MRFVASKVRFELMREPQVPLESFDALFVAISPLGLQLDDWLAWRARYLRNDVREGRSIGQGATLADLTSLDGLAEPWTRAIEIAFERARRFPGALVPLAQSEASLHDSIAAQLRVPAVATSIWLLASSEIGPCLVVGCAFENARPVQTDFSSALFAWLGANVADRLEADLQRAAPVCASLLPAIDVQIDKTHFVAVYKARAADPVLERRYLQIHLTEEDDAKDEARDYVYDGSSLRYAHVGYTYTTFATSKLSDAIFLIPSCAMAQLSWAHERFFEGALRDRFWDPQDAPKGDAAKRLSKFGRITLELKLLELSRLAFREALRPWQQRLFTRYIEYWQIEESSRLIEDASGQIASFLSANVAVSESAANDSQSFILYVIALLGVLGLVGTVSAYIDLLNGVVITDALRHSSGYVVSIGILFVVTIALTVLGIVIGIRQRQ